VHVEGWEFAAQCGKLFRIGDLVDAGDLEAEALRSGAQEGVERGRTATVGFGDYAHAEFAPALRLTASFAVM
jgi:hypothetical protein